MIAVTLLLSAPKGSFPARMLVSPERWLDAVHGFVSCVAVISATAELGDDVWTYRREEEPVFDKRALMAARVAAALAKAVSEHGAPNTFSFSELVGYADAMEAGRAVRRHWQDFCIGFAIKVPLEFAGTRVDLIDGRIHVNLPDLL